MRGETKNTEYFNLLRSLKAHSLKRRFTFWLNVLQLTSTLMRSSVMWIGSGVTSIKVWEPLPHITGTLRINVGTVGYVENEHCLRSDQV